MKQTMKQHSFTSQLKSLAVVFGIALTFASCANEDVAQNPTTNPNEETNNNLTTFVAGDETKTRTSLDYNSSDFYWEAGDYIYVKDDDGILRKSTNAPTQKVASFKYKVPGKFTASSSYKVYYLGKNSSGNAVTISSTQTQTSPDNTEHFGTVGDYGTATANKITGKNQFKFELEHQPAYLVFQPYTSNTVLQNCYLTKIEVTSDNDIAETYTINTSTDNLDASAGGKQIVLTTKSTSGAYTNGFPLTNSSASRTTNGAYMIIKPGTHILKVRYWIKDLTTQVEGTITKSLPSTAYVSNTYYDLTANLNVKDYDGDHYYMWDAQDQYWKGHEWNHSGSQPTLSQGLPGATTSSDYPKSGDPRFWNTTDPGYGVSNPATHTSFDNIPNANEMSWYCMYGDPRWDADKLWTTMGHLYKSGMWFKRKSVLIAENHYDTEKSADGSTDLRTAETPYNNNSSKINSGVPSDTDAGNYFFLPSLGYYDPVSKLYLYNGCYWSSSGHPTRSSYGSYMLWFYSGRVTVKYDFRSNGMRTQKFSDFGDN